ncbi:MAG: carboxypeptidase M32 [Bacteroidetes bacterium]|nr:carboxypeptidase M32 [Bacteroidota bacterium]
MSYINYIEKLKKIADINYAYGLLSWDQEVYMPENGATRRSGQIATLASVSHQLSTDNNLGSLLTALSKDATLTTKQKRNVELSLKDYNKSIKLPSDFVELMSKTVSESFVAWQKAKTTNDFSVFAPKLHELVELKKKQADLMGYENHPYDALIDTYEPGITTAEIDTLFKDVRNKLVPFVKQITALPQTDDSVMYQHFPKKEQWDFGIYLLEQMGYDFKSGRQDISSHPFTINFGAKDVRVTTRINENDLAEMIWSCIHEGGHALYEQGLPDDEYALPCGEAASLAIHESQSRLWENNVGRGLPYWKNNFSKAKEFFPEQLKNCSVENFYKAMNCVKPSLIRTSADELTYHFHIMIRFEIEKSLLEGALKVAELPEYWNAKYKEYLGIDVPNNQKGVLQDIHWSHGSFGYFPTYSLGSFYAAQFYQQAKKELPSLENEIEKGNMQPLLHWLRDKIHAHGRFYTANQLCEKITGEKLNFSYFYEYAKEKYSGIYGVKLV